MASERQVRIAKVMASAMGADVGDDGGGGEIDLTKPRSISNDLVGANEAASLPFNIGYGSID